ncbi:hypothetical protein DUNSADRAFT_8158 [Dunaliella salina]|uniref:Encoded protein n=1 Tax=Dunaliella salina TaxID=3046 RepID=A0ABQ7FSX7_DUNSA|nr:hypothetical protein DUNSADRAFT_8158 [Dunaliella salina]|eukprot:KAF5825605.1 hypothetical protein DUNSADRAFT_8158 [Dunaliella salina]
MHRNLQEPVAEHERGNAPACDPALAPAAGKAQKGTGNGGNGKGSHSHSFASSQVYFKRQLLARTVEGREVDLLTITDHHGAADEYESMPPAPHR